MSANDELQAHTCEKLMEFYGDVANNVAQGNLQDNVKKSHITTENKPKSKKTTKDVQKKCLSLTEQWKKGELEQGWYYVQLIRGEYRIDLYIKDKNEWIDCPDAIINAVVCAVPSYEEWVYLHKARNDAHEIVESLTKENAQLRKFLEEFNALDVAKENQQLKELLRECYKMLAQYHVENSEPSLDENIELLTKIDNAIGEKK